MAPGDSDSSYVSDPATTPVHIAGYPKRRPAGDDGTTRRPAGSTRGGGAGAGPTYDDFFVDVDSSESGT
jgi:hypothetical protein